MVSQLSSHSMIEANLRLSVRGLARTIGGNDERRATLKDATSSGQRFCKRDPEGRVDLGTNYKPFAKE